MSTSPGSPGHGDSDGECNEETSTLDLLHRTAGTASILRKADEPFALRGEIRCDALQHHSRWCQAPPIKITVYPSLPQNMFCFGAPCLGLKNSSLSLAFTWSRKPGQLETSNAYCWKYSKSESTSAASDSYWCHLNKSNHS